MDTLKLLCHCISPFQNTELILSEVNSSEFDWDPVIYCSGQHLVTPALWFYLKQKEIYPMLNQQQREYLELIYQLNLTRNKKIKKQLLALLPDLNAAGIEPLLLKGIASLLGDLYESPGIRVLADIDILIPEDKLTIASKILLEHGYTYTPFLHQAVIIENKHLPAFLHEQQPAAIEVHRYPVALKYSRWVNCTSAWDDTLAIALKTGTVRLPSPEFRLLHNFCHSQLDDKAYLIAYINARQMLDWVRLRHSYETELDWTSIKKTVEKNHSTAAWGGYVLAAESFFLQALIPDTKIPLLAHFYLYRQQWGMRYASYWKVNYLLVNIFCFINNVISTLLYNFQQGPRSFFKALRVAFKLLFSVKWYERKWKMLKKIE